LKKKIGGEFWGVVVAGTIPMTFCQDLLSLVYHCVIEKILGDGDMMGVVHRGDRDIV